MEEQQSRAHHERDQPNCEHSPVQLLPHRHTRTIAQGARPHPAMLCGPGDRIREAKTRVLERRDGAESATRFSEVNSSALAHAAPTVRRVLPLAYDVCAY